MQQKPDPNSLPAGSNVVVRMDNGDLYATRTRSRPWKLGNGGWVVAIEGKRGGYSFDRIVYVRECPAA